jgi:hypothetical protein
MSLIHLSKELTENLLIRHIDKFPIGVVARQLRNDRRLLHWYVKTDRSVISRPYT